MKPIFLTLVVLFGFALFPALAGEGNNDPFPGNFGTMATIQTLPQVADTGSGAYPDVTGRPGSNLPGLVGEVLPTNGGDGAVQTANSLPYGTEKGVPAYAQERSIDAWMMAHPGHRVAALAVQ